MTDLNDLIDGVTLAYCRNYNAAEAGDAVAAALVAPFASAVTALHHLRQAIAANPAPLPEANWVRLCGIDELKAIYGVKPD